MRKITISNNSDNNLKNRYNDALFEKLISFCLVVYIHIDCLSNTFLWLTYPKDNHTFYILFIINWKFRIFVIFCYIYL